MAIWAAAVASASAINHQPTLASSCARGDVRRPPARATAARPQASPASDEPRANRPRATSNHTDVGAAEPPGTLARSIVVGKRSWNVLVPTVHVAGRNRDDGTTLMVVSSVGSKKETSMVRVVPTGARAVNVVACSGPSSAADVHV